MDLLFRKQKKFLKTRNGKALDIASQDIIAWIKLQALTRHTVEKLDAIMKEKENPRQPIIV